MAATAGSLAAVASERSDRNRLSESFSSSRARSATVCWAVGVQDGAPPADCNPVPGAALNPANWARTVNIREIQSANGAG